MACDSFWGSVPDPVAVAARQAAQGVAKAPGAYDERVGGKKEGNDQHGASPIYRTGVRNSGK